MADVQVERTTTTTQPPYGTAGHQAYGTAGYNPQQYGYYRTGQPGQPQHPITDSIKGMLPDRGPSASQVAAVATLVPVGGILLAISGVTLTGTVIGLAVATPLFVIFSPILVPAALAVALGVTGFLASGALGLTGLSSLSWILSHIRGVKGTMYEQMDYAKRRAQETAAQVGHQVGQRTKEVGQGIQNKSHEVGRTEGGRTEGGGRTETGRTTEGGRTTTHERTSATT